MVPITEWPLRNIATARRMMDGRIVVLTDIGTCVWLDPHGQETRSFETGCQGVLAPGIDVTANGRVLLPDFTGNRVLEFGPSGELLWQATVTRPVSVQRLPDGNTLVCSASSLELIEVDRQNRVTWRHRTSFSPVTAIRVPPLSNPVKPVGAGQIR
jgi:hypothetical protein